MLYVDPPVSPLSLIRHAGRWRDMITPYRKTESPCLGVWTPKVLPGQNTRVGQTLNSVVLARGLRRRMDHPDLVVAFSVEARATLGKISGRRVYYCTDSVEDQPGMQRARVEEWERELIGRCDIVVACSLPLVQQLRDRGASPVYIPHGCEPIPMPDDSRPAPELAGCPAPVVGYVGSLNFRIDTRLLEAALDATDGGTLVLVGGAFGPKAAPGLQRLAQRHDVVATGHREGMELGRLLRHMDVALVPYGDHPFNRKSFPLKIPQYLAAGLPVVSTPNGATDELGALVEVAGTPEEFADAVSRAARRKPAASLDDPAHTITARTWDRVTSELLAASGVTSTT